MTPQNDYIAIEAKESKGESKTSGGIILPSENNALKRGKVVYVCANPKVKVKKGDTVLYTYGIAHEDKGKTYYFVKSEEIVAVE